MLPSFTLGEWLLAILAAFCIGFSKSGFLGTGLITVIILARLFPPRESTGVLLPLLLVGDIAAVLVFQKHALWKQIWRMLPPTLVGVGIGALLMGQIPEAQFNPVIGWTVLVMIVVQMLRKLRPEWVEKTPHTRSFAWSMGGIAGVTTMLANAAGPVMTIYFLAVNLPKYVLVGTSAWFFLIVNVVKMPLSAGLGLITPGSLLFNAVLIPAVALGMFAGERLMPHLPQGIFEACLLVLAGLSALRLIGLF